VFSSSLIIWVILKSTSLFSADLIYFASLEEKTFNSRAVSSNLYLNPVKKALTESEFKFFYWNIIVDKRTESKNLVEKGIKAFLLKNGKLSVESFSKKENFALQDEIRVFFEGYFKNNVEIEKIENIDNSSKKKVYFRGLFAPLSYPDNWSRIMLMDKIKSDYKYFKSFFR
jgi:hypothetical protein